MSDNENDVVTTSKKLQWDQIGEHFYETGADRCVLYPLAADGTYPKGYAWNGFTKLTENPSGAEATALYANNTKYLNLMSAEEYGGNIGAYTYPDEFAACDGSASIGDGITIGQQPRQPFGLCYRTLIGNDTEGDAHGYKLHMVYNATASPSGKEHDTVNNDPNAVEFDWEFSTTPLDVPGFKKPTSTIEIDSTKVSAEFLSSIEDILYGTDETDARLPLPAEIVELYNESLKP